MLVAFLFAGLCCIYCQNCNIYSVSIPFHLSPDYTLLQSFTFIPLLLLHLPISQSRFLSTSALFFLLHHPMNIPSFIRLSSSGVSYFYKSHSQIEEFQSFEPNYFFNLADFLCAFTSAFYLRFRDKDKMKGVSLCICTFLMCFGRA